MKGATALLSLALTIASWDARAVGGSDPGYLREQPSLGLYGGSIAQTGVERILVEGREEVLVGTQEGFFTVAWDEPAKQMVPRIARYGFGGGGLTQVHAGDVDGDGVPDVVALDYSGALHVFDARDGTKKGVMRPVGGANRFELARFEGGNHEAIVVLTPSGLSVFTFGQTDPLWTLATPDASGLAVGRFGASSRDIAVSFGPSAPGLIVDGSTHTVHSTFARGFGPSVLRAGDLDGDGIDELVWVDQAGALVAFDVITQRSRWGLAPLPYSYWTLARIEDVDGDDLPEILAGGRVLDGLTGHARLDLPPLPPFVDAVAVDVDGDCSRELVGGISDYGSSFAVFSLKTGQLLWRNLQQDGTPVIAAGDLDGDGHTELVCVSRDSQAGYSGPLVAVVDLHHQRFTYAPWTALAPFSTGGGVLLAQLDGDPALEYVLDAGRRLAAYDGATHELQWRTEPFSFVQYIRALTSGDLLGLGTPQIAVATDDGYVRVFGGSDGALLWTSPKLPSIVDVKIANVNQVPGDDLLVSTSSGVYAFDHYDLTVKWLFPASPARIAVTDIDGNGTPDVVLGTANGHLLAFDGVTRAVLFDQTVGGGVLAMEVARLDEGGPLRIILVAANSLQVRSSTDQSLIWQSDTAFGDLGNFPGGPALLVGDVDDDGRQEICVATRGEVHVFERVPALPDTLPPNFRGSPGLSSVETLGCCGTTLGWALADDDESPPVTYAVYRSAVADFTPGPATLIARTSFPFYRDNRLPRNEGAFYVVRAVDAAGNEDQNLVVGGATDAPGPAVTDEPRSLHVCSGEPATFQVTAAANGPLAYQWTKDGIPIGGALSSSYSLAVVGPADGGVYRCLVTDGDSCSSLSSGAALLVGAGAGDANGNCSVDVGDVFFLVNGLFAGGPPGGPGGDVNGDQSVDVRDVFHLINYLLANGPPPL